MMLPLPLLLLLLLLLLVLLPPQHVIDRRMHVMHESALHGCMLHAMMRTLAI
jgi:hypothetical protein